MIASCVLCGRVAALTHDLVCPGECEERLREMAERRAELDAELRGEPDDGAEFSEAQKARAFLRGSKAEWRAEVRVGWRRDLELATELCRLAATLDERDASILAMLAADHLERVREVLGPHDDEDGDIRPPDDPAAGGEQGAED